MLTCKICNNNFSRSVALGNHVKIKHDIKYLEYKIKYELFNIPKCKICGKDAKNIKGHGIRYQATCGDIICNDKIRRTRIFSEETRERSRKSHFEYFKKRTGESPWERKNSGKLSYLENWFFTNVIIKNSLLSKYDIVNEFPEYPFFIDFAFVNVRLAVELDGKQHFRNTKNQDRDKRKQEKLIERGWKVYRIRFDEVCDAKINDFLEVLSRIEDYNTKTFEPILYRFSEYKSKKESHKREEYIKNIRNKRREEEKENIQKVINSGIDFSKFGWVGKVAKIIDKKSQKVSHWVKTYCPEILDRSYKRKIRLL